MFERSTVGQGLCNLSLFQWPFADLLKVFSNGRKIASFGTDRFSSLFSQHMGSGPLVKSTVDAALSSNHRPRAT